MSTGSASNQGNKLFLEITQTKEHQLVTPHWFDLCRALLYTQANLKSSVDALKSKKQQDELPEEDEDDKAGKS